MFMIDMHATPEVATRSNSSRTPAKRYCGSCMAKATRSYSPGSAPSGPPADNRPGKSRESISTWPSRPRTGKRTRMPSALIRSASSGRQISFAEWPASNNLAARSEP